MVSSIDEVKALSESAPSVAMIVHQPYGMNITSSLGKICIFSSRYRSGVIINVYITSRWQSECNIFVFVQISVWDTFVFIQISVWDILYHQYFYLCLLFCLSSMSFNAQNICCRLTISLDVVDLFMFWFIFYVLCVTSKTNVWPSLSQFGPIRSVFLCFTLAPKSFHDCLV